MGGFEKGLQSWSVDDFKDHSCNSQTTQNMYIII